MLNSDLTRKTIYKSDNITITKTSGIIEWKISAVKTLPTKDDIDASSNGESWLPAYGGYILIWNYISKDNTDIAILAMTDTKGIYEVRDISNNVITDYRLYGRVFYVSK